MTEMDLKLQKLKRLFENLSEENEKLRRSNELLEEELKGYRKQEEFATPCSIGDTVYRIDKESKEIIAMKVFGIHMIKRYQKSVVRIDCVDATKKEHSYLKEWFGKCVFLTKEDAELKKGKINEKI